MSLGLEDQALFLIYWGINPKARLMTLDTLRLSTETYSLSDQTKLRYNVDVEIQYPDMDAVGKMVKEKGKTSSIKVAPTENSAAESEKSNHSAEH